MLLANVFKNFLTGLAIKFVQNWFFRQVPAVGVANDGHYQCKTLTPVGQEGLDWFSFLTISVVPGNELEGLVAEKDREGELQDNHPLIEWESRNVEDNLKERERVD